MIHEVVSSVFRFFRRGNPSPEVAAAVQAGTISGPYRPEEFSIFSLARRDGGRIARLVIADTCDGDSWENTNLRSIVSLETAYMLGEIAGEEAVR